MKKFNIYLICVLSILLLTACAERDPFPNLKLPVYPNAINLKTHLNHPVKGGKAITYQLRAIFPAQDVTEFHNKGLEKEGFRKYHDPLLALKGFEWNTFNPRTGKWEISGQPPARYTASWVNDKEDEFVWLVIDFKPSNDDIKKKGTCFVSIHVARFSAYSRERKWIMK